MLYHSVLCCVVPDPTILHHVFLCLTVHNALSCTVLCYAMLYNMMQCCTIVYHAMLHRYPRRRFCGVYLVLPVLVGHAVLGCGGCLPQSLPDHSSRPPHRCILPASSASHRPQTWTNWNRQWGGSVDGHYILMFMDVCLCVCVCVCCACAGLCMCLS